MLWAHSSLDRVRKCRHTTTAGSVAVVKRQGHAHYSGLQTCGSVWSCPCCAERVLAGRADELLHAVEHWHALGGKVAMLTLTMRHDVTQPLDWLWGAFQPAWAAASGGSTRAREAMAAADVQHWVRRTECTIGAEGWHLHAHVLLFLPVWANADSAGEVGLGMFVPWAKALVRRGMRAPLGESGGLDIRLLDLENAREHVTGYLSKGTYESAREQARRAAREMASSGRGKRGRRSNRSTMQLLADVVARGDYSDLERWREWEQASRGRRAMTWSRGARQALLPDEEELTDEQLAAESDDDGEIVALLDRGTWAAVRDYSGIAPALLELVEDASDATAALAAITTALQRLGLGPPTAPQTG